MNELFNYLLTSEYSQYVLAICLLCRVFVTVAPIKLTMHIPDGVMMIISAAALASNKKVDNKGNPL